MVDPDELGSGKGDMPPVQPRVARPDYFVSDDDLWFLEQDANKKDYGGFTIHNEWTKRLIAEVKWWRTKDESR